MIAMAILMRHKLLIILTTIIITANNVNAVTNWNYLADLSDNYGLNHFVGFWNNTLFIVKNTELFFLHLYQIY